MEKIVIQLDNLFLDPSPSKQKSFWFFIIITDKFLGLMQTKRIIFWIHRDQNRYVLGSNAIQMDTSQVDKCDLVQLSAGVCVVQIQSISWSISNKDSAVPACLIPPKKSTPPACLPLLPRYHKGWSSSFPLICCFFACYVGGRGCFLWELTGAAGASEGKKSFGQNWTFPRKKSTTFLIYSRIAQKLPVEWQREKRFDVIVVLFVPLNPMFSALWKECHKVWEILKVQCDQNIFRSRWKFSNKKCDGRHLHLAKKHLLGSTWDTQVHETRLLLKSANCNSTLLSCFAILSSLYGQKHFLEKVQDMSGFS